MRIYGRWKEIERDELITFYLKSILPK